MIVDDEGFVVEIVVRERGSSSVDEEGFMDWNSGRVGFWGSEGEFGYFGRTEY